MTKKQRKTRKPQRRNVVVHAPIMGVGIVQQPIDSKKVEAVKISDGARERTPDQE